MGETIDIAAADGHRLAAYVATPKGAVRDEPGRGLRFVDRLAICDSSRIDTLLAIPL